MIHVLSAYAVVSALFVLRDVITDALSSFGVHMSHWRKRVAGSSTEWWEALPERALFYWRDHVTPEQRIEELRRIEVPLLACLGR